MKEITILVTCCLGDYMQGTIKCYKNNPDNRPVRVIGVDMNCMAYNFVGVDKFYQVGRCDIDPASYIMELLSICRKEKVDVLIPFNTNELEPISWYEKEFAAIGTKVLVSSSWALEVANDKASFYEFFKDGPIHTPTEMVTGDYDELMHFLELHNYKQFVIKQRHGCGSRGFRIIGRNTNFLTEKPTSVFIQNEELKQLFDNSELFVVQEYLPGSEYTVDMVVDNGTVLYAACKINSEMENGVARRSVIVEPDECMIYQCAHVCHTLNLHGNVGFDLKCDASGVPYIIDVNPRMTATVSLVAKAGINMPYIALQLALGETVRDDYQLKYGTSIIRRIQDYYFSDGGELLE